MKINRELLGEALGCWRRLEGFRRERQRCKNYTFGRQWCDRITVDGVTMTEEEYIIREGNIPLKNNLIRRLVRNVVGIFRDRYDEIEKGWDKSRREENRRQGMAELYGRSLEEFLISGMVVHKERRVRRDGRTVTLTESVCPDSFFLDAEARDPRGTDVRMVGQVHELRFGDYCRHFAPSPAQLARAEARYGRRGRVKVVEVWRKEQSGKLGVGSWELGVGERGEMWRYWFLDERGEVLAQGESPWGEKGHPFRFKCYPFLDGEIHSFVSDVIDQQRYANRLITLYDWVMRASAKGVLLFPEDAMPSEGNLETIADEWSRFNGVITYKARPGMPGPSQVNSASANSGISDLLTIQLKMMEDVSGVHGALQGKTSGGSVSGSLYSQQRESSLTSLRDILDSYESFVLGA